jgi:hypothetical protein
MAPVSGPGGDPLSRLFTAEDFLTRDEAEEIVREGPGLVPRLRAILEDAGLWGQPDPRGWAPVHATILLAALRPPDFLSDLLRALERAQTHGVEVLLGEGGPLLAGAAAPALEPLLELLGDPRRPAFLREMAPEALLALCGSHPELLPRAVTALRKTASESPEIVSVRQAAAGALLDLGDPQDRELLLSFGETDFFDSDYVEEVLAQGARVPLGPLGSPLAFYDPDRARERAWPEDEGVSGEDEAEEGDDLDDLDPEEILPPDPAGDVIEAYTREPGLPPGPLRRQEQKIGRNEPCPCGSGAKFKKCCGR